MFDQGHPIELVGTVQEFRFTSPHVVILLDVKAEDHHAGTWSLEGNSPNSFDMGWLSNTTLKRGDAVRLTIEPLAKAVRRAADGIPTWPRSSMARPIRRDTGRIGLALGRIVQVGRPSVSGAI